MIVHEVIHSLEAGKREGMFLKLDLSKAYDQVDWYLLDKVLNAFGFDSKVHKIISQLVSTSQWCSFRFLQTFKRVEARRSALANPFHYFGRMSREINREE